MFKNIPDLISHSKIIFNPEDPTHNLFHKNQTIEFISNIIVNHKKTLKRKKTQSINHTSEYMSNFERWISEFRIEHFHYLS